MIVQREDDQHLWVRCLNPKHEDTTASMCINKVDSGDYPIGFAYCYSCSYTMRFSKEAVKNMSKQKSIARKKVPIDFRKLQHRFINNLNKKFGVEINLKCPNYTIVDLENFDYLNNQPWRAMKDGKTYYVRRCHTKKFPIEIQMHRLILGLTSEDKQQVDHINNDGLDNRKCNLRVCIINQNIWNGRGKESSSKYKGVWLNSGRGPRWKSGIRPTSEKQIHLGYFDNEVDAAKVYDEKAKELFGEFAHLNFPESLEYRLKDFADDLKISIDLLRDLRIGWFDETFCIPMYNEDSKVIGVQRRFRDGTKRCVKGSSLGLFNLNRLPLESPLVITEGATDMLVASQLGHNSIGKPSAGFGSELVRKYLENIKYKGKVIICQDGDPAGKLSRVKLVDALSAWDTRVVVPDTDLKDYYLENGASTTKALLRM